MPDREGAKLRTLKEPYTVTPETFESLFSYWLDASQALTWECVFVLPGWLQVWWEVFGSGVSPQLCAVKRWDEVIGIAPLMVQGDKARFIGDPEVCDYQDFIVAPGRGERFFEILIEHLQQEGITHLDLRPLRADSTVLTDLVRVARRMECEVSCNQEDVFLELQLPSSWDEFLQRMSGKERHELRRKLRRLSEAADITYRVVENAEEVKGEMDTFLKLFASNRSDKAAFMTSQMASFFRSLAEALAKENILRLFFLDLDSTPGAAVMCFDYNSTMYLYNNGYDSRFRSLSVGLLSKVSSIRESIDRGREKYDFLKGNEDYKRRLGGSPYPLYRCQIELRGS